MRNGFSFWPDAAVTQHNKIVNPPKALTTYFNPRRREKSHTAMGRFEVDRPLRRAMFETVGDAVSVSMY